MTSRSDILDEVFTALDEVEDLGIEDAEGFCASVREKAESMARFAERHGELTAGQERALENMLAGLQRWMR